MMAREEAERVLQAALEATREQVDVAEAALVGGQRAVTRFADGEVHQSIDVTRERLSMRVFVDGQCVVAETTDLSTQGIRATAQRARAIAELVARRAPTLVPAASSAAPLPEAQHYRRIENHDVDTERAVPLDRMALVGRIALEAARAELSVSGRVVTGVGGVERDARDDTPYAIANSRGVFAYAVPTRAALGVVLRRRDGRTSVGDAEAHALSMLDVETAVGRAFEKARVDGPLRPVATATAPRGDRPEAIVLEPEAVAALVRVVADGLGADLVARGRSPFSGRLGRELFGTQVDLTDDAGHPLQRGRAFDVDGAARRRVPLVVEGRFDAVVSSWSSAERHGGTPTGHAVRPGLVAAWGEPLLERAEHPILSIKGAVDRRALLDALPRALVLSRLDGLRVVDLATLTVAGHSRDGAFWLERGQLVAAAPEVSFEVALPVLLSRIVGASSSERALGAVVPALAVEPFALLEARGPRDEGDDGATLPPFAAPSAPGSGAHAPRPERPDTAPDGPRRGPR
jgi:predicted Zn-dependent protease